VAARIGAAGGACLMALGLSATAGPGALASARPAPKTGLQAGRGQSPAAVVADAVQRVAAARFGGLYTGEILTDHGRKVVVYLTRLDKTAEAAMTAGVAPGIVSFARAPRPLAWLNRLHQRVTGQQPALKRAGINLVTWGPDFITGRENLTVQDLTAAKAAVLDRLFGTGNLTLTSTTARYAAVAVGRDNDSPPWNGGDFMIDDPVTGECSSGYGVTSGSTSYSLTAGHCFTVNAEVINGDPSLTGKTYYEMGTVSTRGSFTKSDGIDAEMVKTTGYGSSSKAIYTGSSTKPQVADVSGTATSPAGDQVCDSGAFEGEVCDIVIQKTTPMPECITESEGSGGPTYTVCDIYVAEQASGKIAVGNGDSGGPVFRFEGSKLYATGIITAEPSGGTVCPTRQYKGFSTRYCSPTLFYTSISSVLSEFKVKINT
jgi:hypothetical protein